MTRFFRILAVTIALALLAAVLLAGGIIAFLYLGLFYAKVVAGGSLLALGVTVIEQTDRMIPLMTSYTS